MLTLRAATQLIGSARQPVATTSRPAPLFDVSQIVCHGRSARTPRRSATAAVSRTFRSNRTGIGAAHVESMLGGGLRSRHTGSRTGASSSHSVLHREGIDNREPWGDWCRRLLRSRSPVADPPPNPPSVNRQSRLAPQQRPVRSLGVDATVQLRSRAARTRPRTRRRSARSRCPASRPGQHPRRVPEALRRAIASR
jgi:hypothetical protein